MRRVLTNCLLSAVATLAVCLSAQGADPGAQIKYRQATMKALGGHMSGLSAILKGEVDLKAHTATHVDGVASTARLARDLFPAGTDKGDTDALPAIWEKPADFLKAATAMEAAAAKLGGVKAGDTEGLKAAFGDLGKSCKGCHDNFRKKK